MNANDFKKMRNTYIEETFELSDTKRIEYTEGHHNENVLWNFENIGKRLAISPMKVLSVYLQKHTSSVFNYIKDGKEYSESIEGRISDIINYLILLLCMIRTYKKKGIQNDPEC